MSYLVYARKYRPQTFKEILGQDPIVTTLTNAVKQRRIGHAYLFAGPRGTGKTSTARIFAKALNCVEGPTVTPCLKCQGCQEIAQGRSLDVLEIDGASNRGIDQIRALREHSKFAPAAGAFKIYLIDEVHQITSEGFNALLKILEEPPPHIIFILATTAPHKVPATILSRCQRYDFKRLPLELIASKIMTIASDEKLQISEEAVLGVARTAGGSLRDAESILDQLAAFTGGKIRIQDLHALLGTIEEDVFAEAIAGIQAKDPVRLLKLVAEASNAGTDLIQWVLSFLTFLRNLLVAKAGAGALGFEDLGAESIERLKKLAEGFTLEELVVMAQVMTGVIDTMRRVGEPRIPLELALVRLSSGEAWTAVSDLVSKLQEIEGRLGKGDRAAASAPVQAAISPATAELSGIEQIASLWPLFLSEVQRQKASTAAFLSESMPIALEGQDPTRLVIGFPKSADFHRQTLDQLPTRQLLEEILAKVVGRPLQFVLRTVDSLPVVSAGSSPKQSAASGAASGPLLNSVLELFEGRMLPGQG